MVLQRLMRNPNEGTIVEDHRIYFGLRGPEDPVSYCQYYGW